MRLATVCLTLVVGAACAIPASAEPWRKGTRVGPSTQARRTLVEQSSTDGPGWSDNFNSYANGSQIIGQGGWEAWAVPAYPLPPTGFADNAQAVTGNSCRLTMAGASNSQTDMVHQYTTTGGQWVYKIKTYIPSTAVATTAPYFILLRDYQSLSGGTNHWSVQCHFDKATNLVVEDNWMGGGVAFPENTFTNLPIIYDQWVEIRAEIDLDVQDGRVKLFYGGTPLADHKWYDTPGTPLAPPYTLKAIDIYDDGIDVAYFDDASLAPATVQAVCYPNCDNSTTQPCLNVQDFGCFLNKFAGQDTYANCDNSTTAPILNVQDFGCFLNKFAGGCSSC